MIKPEICILKTDGTNCDSEMQNAFNEAGGNAQIVHINELKDVSLHLDDFQVLGLPGGFTYGDDIRAGKILSVELNAVLGDELQEFVDQGKPVLGVCNGFQVLVQAGLLPDGTLGKQTATLSHNESGRFECRWVDLGVEPSVSQFVQPGDFAELPIPIQTAHGEGLYFASDDRIQDLEEGRQVVFRYVTPEGNPAAGYPHNPSGSTRNIAGVTDPSGVVLGLMPHPERSISAFHPHRARTETARQTARVIFNNIIGYAQGM